MNIFRRLWEKLTNNGERHPALDVKPLKIPAEYDPEHPFYKNPPYIIWTPMEKVLAYDDRSKHGEE